MKNRTEEVRSLLRLTPDALLRRAKGRLVICRDNADLHHRFAQEIAAEIRIGNKHNKPVRLILPVGPTGQYPLLADIINREKMNLAHCRFFFMDEYCDKHGQAFPPEHPLSFYGMMIRLFFSRLNPGCGLAPSQVIFPDQTNIRWLGRRIVAEGGIDTCYAGVGIHGHLAFNEPGAGVKESGPRRVTLNDFTVTLNAIRAGVGGNLENFPRQAFTLGLQQILSARRIRLFCRNDIPGIQWANTVLRLALFGEPGDDYPVTHIRKLDYQVFTTVDTAQRPITVL